MSRKKTNMTGLVEIYINKMKSIKNDSKFFEKEFLRMQNFITKSSSDIKYNLVLYASKILNRNKSINELLKYVKHYHIAIGLEKGIYEFALIHITINKFQNNIVEFVYNDKLLDISANLDITDKRIDNQTLLSIVLENQIDPKFVSFLSPEQLHPKRWNDIIAKRELQYETVNNLQTTDRYKCKKCGERKFKVTEIQLRCADEPMSRIHTCTSCGFTFIK
jgi:DNA-directed RNA polymerase subunit M/transcription elongation factor TFIIS